MVKYYYENENNVKESNLGALFSFPPYSKLPERGKHYAKRYWVAMGVLMICITLLIPGHNYGA